MDLATALRTVHLDVQQSYPRLTLPLAIKLAREVTRTVGLNPDDEPTYTAYKVVMVASVAEIVLAIAKIYSLALDHGDALEIDGEPTIDGQEPFTWLDEMGDAS